jgi:DMSO/TMAO reductase YedYZ molybdopterin-dependent catalytic subunit
MRHPEASARQINVPETSVSLSGLIQPGSPAAGRRGAEQAPSGGRQIPRSGGRASRVAAPRTPAAASEPHLPPGQYVPAAWPVLHYGPVPTFHPDTWDLRVLGATESGSEHRWSWDELGHLPRCQVVADFHCVTKFTIPGIAWEGIAAAELLRAVPPDAAVTHVMVWADFGYSANLAIADFAADDTLFATHRDGNELTPEHGYPLRLVVPSRYAWKSVKWVRAVEYLTRDRRGFWEERGYHNTADPWREQRYSYQERPGEGPPLV